MSTPQLTAASALIQDSHPSPKATNTELPAGKQLFFPHRTGPCLGHAWAMPGPGVALGAEETGEEKASHVGMAVSFTLP